eukprot:gene24034-biopygen8908
MRGLGAGPGPQNTKLLLFTNSQIPALSFYSTRNPYLPGSDGLPSPLGGSHNVQLPEETVRCARHRNSTWSDSLRCCELGHSGHCIFVPLLPLRSPDRKKKNARKTAARDRLGVPGHHIVNG